MMDGHGQPPRPAFGHLDQDGCVEEDAKLKVDVLVAAVSGDRLCSIALKRQELVEHLKMRISAATAVPESDQTLLLPSGQRLAAKRRLGSVLPRRSETVTLVVARPSCSLLRREGWPLGTPRETHSMRPLPRSILLLA